MATRTYSITLDMPGGVCANLVKLQAEIAAPGNGVSTKLNSISAVGDDLLLDFDAALSAGEITALDGDAGAPHATHPAGGLLAAHDDTPSPEAASPVAVTNEPSIVVKQERGTVGHYKILPLKITAPAGTTRYVDRVVPDYTRGLDWLSAFFDGDGVVEAGDEICCGKMLVGQIAAVAADAAQDATTVVLIGPATVLKPTADGGALDEGFFLSFGVENTTAAGINAAPPTATAPRTFANCDQELKEYEIKRIGAQTPIGGGNCTVTITLFTGLIAAVTAGTAANLVSNAIPEPLLMGAGEVLDIGGQAILAGNMPAGSRIRAGFSNNGAASKTICGKLIVMYGGS